MSLVEAVRILANAFELGVVVTDGELTNPGPRILYVNAAFEQMTGYGAAELLGRSPRMLQGEKTSLIARKALSRALRRGHPHKATLVNYRQNGDSYLCQIEVFPVCDVSGQLVYAIAIEREVERRRGRPKNTSAQQLLGAFARAQISGASSAGATLQADCITGWSRPRNSV